MEIPKQSKETPQEIFLKNLGLTAGRHIKLVKKQGGSTIEGVIDIDIKIGRPISLDKKSQAGVMLDFETEGGKIFLKTNYGVYELVLDTTKIIEKRKTLTRADLEIALSNFTKKGYKGFGSGEKVPDYDDPMNCLILDNGFKEGDKVIFFAEKERRGVLEKMQSGTFTIRDEKGNPWGIQGLLMHLEGYIKKA